MIKTLGQYPRLILNQAYSNKVTITKEKQIRHGSVERLCQIVELRGLKSKTELARTLRLSSGAITQLKNHVTPLMAMAAQAAHGVNADWILYGKNPIFIEQKFEDPKAVAEAANDSALEAVASDLLNLIGEDTSREGLRETPKRMCRAWKDFFVGYKQDPKQILNKVFEEVGGYDEIVLLKNIRVQSHCEHHFVPIIGHAHVAYLPNKRVVGISKLARVVEAYSKRLQVQERLTQEIADCITEVLKPLGVAVVISSTHHCMTTRGVRMVGANMVTSSMSGAFRNAETRQELFQMINGDNL